jgi:formylglycine-generating enzyme required for sulfatase activity
MCNLKRERCLKGVATTVGFGTTRSGLVVSSAFFAGTNSLGMSSVAIPAGTYEVGCTPGQSNCGSDAKPAHKVKLTRSFSIMTTEVT